MAHCCHALGCKKVVAPHLLMCARHWYMVPKDIQAEVWRHYRSGQEKDMCFTPEYHLAAVKAENAIALKEKIITKDEADKRIEAVNDLYGRRRATREAREQ